MTTFTYKSPYEIYENCYFVINKYAIGGGLSIQIWNNEYGPISYVTVNTGGSPLNKNQIMVKDYSDCKGMLDEMKRIGLVKSVDRYVESGFVNIPVCTYDKEVLDRYS